LFWVELNWQKNVGACRIFLCWQTVLKKHSVARVRERNIPTERQQLVGEVCANFPRYQTENPILTTKSNLGIFHARIFFLEMYICLISDLEIYLNYRIRNVLRI
jgi:hypothetical protein